MNTIIIFGNKRYKNLNSESFFYGLKYEDFNATIILMKESKIKLFQPCMPEIYMLRLKIVFTSFDTIPFLARMYI